MKKHLFFKLSALISLVVMSACSPKFDWREIRNDEANFVVLLPSKPAVFSREIQLEDVKVTMKMQAAKVDDINFAVGFFQTDNNSDKAKLLAAMKTGMLKNIQGKEVIEGDKNQNPSNKSHITAVGKLASGGNVKMVAQFVSQGPWLYQVVVMGDEKQLTPEVVDMFMTSFKLNSK
jgi:hypothetical protein